VGDEVMVAYLDGDPDEPVIIGRVFNGFSRSPLNLPADRTQSVWKSKSSPGGEGFNQILMEDLAGQERLELHAQRDFISRTRRNSTTRIGVQQTVIVGNDSKSNVGGNQDVNVKGDRNVVVDGVQFWSTGTSIEWADSGMIKGTAGNRHDSANHHFLDNRAVYAKCADVFQIVAPHFHVFSGAAVLHCDPGRILLKVGGSSITITGGGIVIESSGPVDIKGNPINLNC
jgi:type VI secretion system secreted protein VgrG